MGVRDMVDEAGAVLRGIGSDFNEAANAKEKSYLHGFSREVASSRHIRAAKTAHRAITISQGPGEVGNPE